MNKKSIQRLLAMLMAVVMCLAMLPTAALAAEEGEKTITVGENQTYTDIQAAINHIQDQDDKEDWTIIVESGTYLQFAIPKQQKGLTIQAAEGATVSISTWTGEANSNLYLGNYSIGGGIASKGYYNDQGYSYAYYGVYVQAQDVTLSGLSFTLGSYSSYWYRACVTDIGGTSSLNTVSTGLTISGCSFSYADGVSSGYGVLITASTGWTVTGSTFYGLANAIDFMCDNFAVTEPGIVVSDNTFIECSFALHGYYSQAGNGSITITGNTLTGTAALYSKIAIQDASSGNGFTVSVTDNTLTNALVGFINISDVSEDTINTIFDENTFVSNAFAVISNDTGTATTTSATYYAPSSDTGYWKVTGVDDLDVSWGGNPEDTTATAKSDVSSANEESSHTLTTSGYRSFSWFKDAIYWISGNMPSAKVSYPGLEKKIVLTDGTLVDEDDIAAGDTVTYQLTSNVPSNLDEYITYSADEGSDNTNVIPLGTVIEGATYTITFHDTMDSKLTLNSDSITVTLVKYALDEDGLVTEEATIVELSSQYYTINTECSDDCDFEVSVELLALYTAGIITEADFGSCQVIVGFTADLDENAGAGAYQNTAWVTYVDDDGTVDGETEKDTVVVYTYGIKIFKFDQADNTGLEGATFGLYSDAECTNLIATLTSDASGYATIEGLDTGIYYLKETAAPSGYVKSDSVLTVSIKADVNAETYLATVNFANAEIPSTGGAGTAIYTTVGVGILALAAILFVLTRKKNNAE